MRMRTLATAVLPMALLTTALTIPLAAGPALADGGDGGGFLKAGACSAASNWTLEGSRDNGRLEVEFEVDSHRAGQSWDWKLFDNNMRVGAGSATTTSPDGSFQVRRRIADRPGKDVISFQAVNAASGEQCKGSLTIPARPA